MDMKNVKLEFTVDTDWGMEGVLSSLQALISNIERVVYKSGSEWALDGSGFRINGKISGDEKTDSH